MPRARIVMNQASSFWVRHPCRLCNVRGGNAGALHCALAGYAAPLLGDGVGLYHLQPADRGDTVEGALSHAGNADRRSRDDCADPEPRERTRTAQPRHRAVGRHFPVSFADRRHPAQLRVHAVRLHRRAARLSHPFDARIDVRHRRRPRAGNHARYRLCERRFDAGDATERRLCNCSKSGRLARRCASAWRGCPDRPWQRPGA